MTWQRLACSSLVVSVVILCMGVVLVDVNRFIGTMKNSCSRYNDSVGGVNENGTRVCFAERNQSEQSDPGIVFGNTTRSELAWVYITVVLVLAIVLSLGSYLYRIWERHQNIREVTEDQRDEHSGEHQRICLVLYLCTAVVLLYQAVVLVKVVRCRRTFAEGCHTFVSLMSLVVQG